ncbi:WYL domain-containing protein [Nonomuraea phyllanthi]|uniref:WYL domain-containing protein n=2 Tax=Nonomuraea phyllanthi TaxID=2219224 RepID=A0A5C4W4L6_9ACTN|nr:WYL domain-containing protein [Nonomuraea phyllanthi]
MTVPMGRAGSTVDPASLAAIAAACRDHETLRFDYRTHEGQESVRAAEPYRLIHSGRHWYLLGWDTGRDDWRTYRVDRLSLRTPNGARFVPRDLPDSDLAAYMSRSISSAPYRYQGRFTMHAPAEVVAEHMPATTGTIEPIDERTCVLSSGANDLDELAVWVALMDVDFEVHEPPELVDRIRALSARLATAAAVSSASSVSRLAGSSRAGGSGRPRGTDPGK